MMAVIAFPTLAVQGIDQVIDLSCTSCGRTVQVPGGTEAEQAAAFLAADAHGATCGG